LNALEFLLDISEAIRVEKAAKKKEV